MKVIIAGGRGFQGGAPAEAFLDAARQHLGYLGPIEEVITGGATGADAMGKAWARTRGLPWREFPAQWDKYGKSAGPLRNAEMARHAAPGGLLIAFPGGAGTASMVREAKRVGLRVLAVRHGPPGTPFLGSWI